MGWSGEGQGPWDGSRETAVAGTGERWRECGMSWGQRLWGFHSEFFQGSGVV